MPHQAHLLLEGGNQLARELAIGEDRAAIHDTRAQALVGGESVLLDEGSGLVAQGGSGHAQEVQGDGLDWQLHRPLIGIADVVVVGDLRMQSRSVTACRAGWRLKTLLKWYDTIATGLLTEAPHAAFSVADEDTAMYSKRCKGNQLAQ